VSSLFEPPKKIERNIMTGFEKPTFHQKPLQGVPLAVIKGVIIPPTVVITKVAPI